MTDNSLGFTAFPGYDFDLQKKNQKLSLIFYDWKVSHFIWKIKMFWFQWSWEDNKDIVKFGFMKLSFLIYQMKNTPSFWWW